MSKKLLPTNKNRQWYLEEMSEHVSEIKELLDKDEEIYRKKKTCKEHAKTEAYDLIVLTAELFHMNDILEQVPDHIIERFNRKRRRDH